MRIAQRKRVGLWSFDQLVGGYTSPSMMDLPMMAKDKLISSIKTYLNIVCYIAN
jgi:hypothetical protein